MPVLADPAPPIAGQVPTPAPRPAPTRRVRPVRPIDGYAQGTDDELVAGCREGDQLAWDALVRRYSSRLIATARYHGLDRAAAEDVVQSAWHALAVHLERIENGAAIGGWLRTTVKHAAIRVSMASRRQRALLAAEAVCDHPVDEDVLVTEQIDALRRAFVRLPAESQQLLGLLFSDQELSYVEIAERLGCPVGSIGPTRARHLDKLRALLRQEPGFTDDVLRTRSA